MSVWIALIVGAAGLFAFSQKPFQDTRPPVTTLPLNHHSTDDGQTIEARLWEDPLSAVAAACRSSSPPTGNGAERLHVKLASLGPNAKTLVLAVMVTGEPYTDDIETRRRTRYAVMAGLYRSRLIPTSPDHIGYVGVTLSNPAQANSAGRGPCQTGSSDQDTAADRVFAPFEWFARDSASSQAAQTSPASTERSGQGPDHVLVLWLDQEGFRDLPIRKLSGFLSSVVGKESSANVAILGPADSDGLHAMYEEVLRAQSTNLWQPDDLREMNIYSSRATAPRRVHRKRRFRCQLQPCQQAVVTDATKSPILSYCCQRPGCGHCGVEGASPPRDRQPGQDCPGGRA